MNFESVEAAFVKSIWADAALGASGICLSVVAYQYWRRCEGIDARSLYGWLSIFLMGSGVSRFTAIVAGEMHAGWFWLSHCILKYIGAVFGIVAASAAIRLYSRSRALVPRQTQIEQVLGNQKKVLAELHDLRVALIEKPGPDVSLADRAIRSARLGE